MSCPPVGHYIALEPVLLCDIDKLRLSEHTNKLLTFEKVVEYLGLLACVDTVDTIYEFTAQLDRNWRVNDWRTVRTHDSCNAHLDALQEWCSINFMLCASFSSSGISVGEVGNSRDIPGINIGGAKLAEVLLLVVDEVLSTENKISSAYTSEAKLQTHVAWTP